MKCAVRGELRPVESTYKLPAHTLARLKPNAEITPMAHSATVPASAARGGLYERDYYSWAVEQSRALRDRRAEPLETGTTSRRRSMTWLEAKLESWKVVRKSCWSYLLKWRFLPKRPSTSWRLTIREQRQRLARVMEQNPGLKLTLFESVRAAYALARLVAARETRLGQRTFLDDCAWTFEQLMDAGFLPK
jgi:hypothetical protein